MGTAHCSVTFEPLSGLPRDRVVNTYTFDMPGDFVDGTAAADILDLLNDFYGAVNGTAPVVLGTLLGTQLSRTVAPILRIYDITNDLTGTPAGSPLFTNAMNVLPAASSGNCMPGEVACALTFHADYGADVEFGPGTRPRSRDRGRVYIGPLVNTVISMGGGEACRPSAVLKNTLLQSGKMLKDAAGPDLVVWSRAAGLVKPVTMVSVDDAFDTQRRRGESPTVRTSLV